MRIGTECQLSIDNTLVNCLYIGAGLFSKAYRAGSTVYILCQGDYSKECISLFCDKEKKHIPQITRHDDVKDYQVFSMPFYHKLTKRDFPLAYAQWKNLPSALISYTEASKFINSDQYTTIESIREAIRELIEAFCNYDIDSMMLEFNRANVGVNDKGELILRDCLASRKSIEEKRRRKQSKRRKYGHS